MKDVELAGSPDGVHQYSLRIKRTRILLEVEECLRALKELHREFGPQEPLLALLKRPGGTWMPIFDPVHARGIQAEAIIWVGFPEDSVREEISACLGNEEPRKFKSWQLDHILSATGLTK